jgi:hypothetical protein
VVTKVNALFRASVKFGGGGYGKNTARLGCKVPAALCGAKLRDEFFVNSSLKVIISLDPNTDDKPPLSGMDDEFACCEMIVKVNQYSTNDSDITFSMTFGKAEMPAEFLQTVSHSNGSLYILSVTANEDGSSKSVDEDSGDEDDESEDE